MTISYQGASAAVAYSASGGTSVAPAYPANTTEGRKLLLIIGMKPSTANSGSVTTPADWTPVTSIVGAGGYGTTLGADTGNTNLFVFERTVPAGGLSGSLTVTVATNNVCWAVMLLYSTTQTWGSVAGTTGSDSTAGNVSITFAADPGVAAGDYVVGAMCIPTDVTTPTQFSIEAFSQSGVTFGTVAEIIEPDSATGNDIGGFLCHGEVSTGTSSGVPTMTATAGGTTTNVRGPGVFIRLREASIQPSGTIAVTLANSTSAVSAEIQGSGSINQALSDTSISASGSLLSSGTVSQALANTLSAISGTVQDAAPTGTIAVTLEHVQASISGGIYAQATASQVLGNATAAVAGQVASIGSIVASLAGVAAAAVGEILSSGAIAKTLQDTTASINGVVGNVAVGTVNVTLDPVLAAATGIVSVSGSVSAVLAPVVPSINGEVTLQPIIGQINVTLGSVICFAYGIVGDYRIDLPYMHTVTVSSELRRATVAEESRILGVAGESRTEVIDGGTVE